MSTPPIILIVDDDSSHRAMLRTVLRGWGYATDEADDGDTAVEKVKERAYDAVLSDVRMARMDGISAIREILHHNPSIPVLVMTAWQSVETAVAALRLGAYDYLENRWISICCTSRWNGRSIIPGWRLRTGNCGSISGKALPVFSGAARGCANSLRW